MKLYRSQFDIYINNMFKALRRGNTTLFNEYVCLLRLLENKKYKDIWKQY